MKASNPMAISRFAAAKRASRLSVLVSILSIICLSLAFPEWAYVALIIAQLGALGYQVFAVVRWLSCNG